MARDVPLTGFDRASTGGRLQKRRIFALLAHLGLANVYAMRMDLSEAAEPMQSHYHWSNDEQGYVLSSFFWGYVLSQILGAMMARRWGGKRVFGFGVLGTSVFTMALPWCAQWLWLLYCVRALMGLFEAVTYPALLEMLTHWAPAPERATMVSFCCSGAYVGNALAMPISGAIIGIKKDVSGLSSTWPYAFYTFGAWGCLWFVLWELYASSTPGQHPTISAEERAYIDATARADADTVGAHVQVEKSARVPWIAFIVSPAAWAIYVNHFAFNYGTYTMMTYMPKFLDEVLGMNMKKAGFVSFLPYLLMAAAGIVGGRAADCFLTLSWPIRLVRIVMQLAGFTCSGVFLVYLGYLTDNRPLAVTAMTLSIGLSGLTCAGYLPNFQDISPHYAGQLFGVSNTLSNIAGIIAPIIAGTLLGDAKPSPVENWRKVFYLTAIVYAVAAMVWVSAMQAKPVQAVN